MGKAVLDSNYLFKKVLDVSSVIFLSMVLIDSTS